MQKVKSPLYQELSSLYYIERRDDLIAPTPPGKDDDGMTTSPDAARGLTLFITERHTLSLRRRRNLHFCSAGGAYMSSRCTIFHKYSS
jgi:hypothetical protein